MKPETTQLRGASCELRSNAPVFTRNSQLATHPRNSAFTLIELMISLAMVLILILGINFVFRSATDAVGAGQAINAINTDAQSTQPVLFDDLNHVAKPPPAFIISSQFVTQFLNADDAKTSSDPNVIPIDNAGNYAYIGWPNSQPTFQTATKPEQWTSLATLNNRNHRADVLKFFAHYLYPRRSGPDGTYYSNDTSNDAYVEIGHAALPSSDLTAFYGPSELPAGNNGYDSYMDQLTATPITGVPRTGAYASDWVLARKITLLKDPSTIPPNPPGVNPTNPGNPTNDTQDPFYGVGGAGPWQFAFAGVSPTAYAINMAPLSYGSPDSVLTDNPSATPPSNLSQSSRYDLAGTTPEEFDRLIDIAILGYENNATPYSGTSLWWNPLIYSFQLTQPTGNATAIQSQWESNAPYLYQFFGTVPGFTAPSGTPPSPTGFLDPGLWYARPQCNPTIQNPVTSASLAEMAPYFLQHCSQFIVEYAGDYMQQDQYGNMTNLGPDGQIDFYLDANGNKHIRWYGMPRSTTGVPHLDGPPTQNPAPSLVLIRGFDPTLNGGKGETVINGTSAATASMNYFTDVIPLRDYYWLFNATNTQLENPVPNPPYYACPPWEVDVNFAPARDYGSYLAANTPTAALPNGIAFGDPNNPPRYVAAWHDDMPAMIRILIKLDDPNNKVKDGPWYEYVFRLK